MVEIGKYNELQVKSDSSVGLFLTDGDEDVLLPNRYVKGDLNQGDHIKVFVYLDNENRPVATTETPFAEVGDFAFLKVKEVNNFGAFLDWGISKDLFVAYSEQRNPMSPGERYLVYIFVDELSGRIAATERWQKHFQLPDEIEEGEEVQLLIAEKTDLGWRAIINNTCEGLIYQDEVFQELKPGDLVRGYVRLIRDDGKVDLRLQPEGYSNVENTTAALMHSLEQNNGVLPIGDKSPAEEIYRLLKISKKTFKKAIGALYKQRLVEISDNEVKLVKK